MIFRELDFGSTAYAQTLRLREEILRLPIGLKLSEADCEGENGQRHFGLFASENDLIACVVALRLTPTHLKLRQMAVAEAWQKQGIGSQLLRQVERLLVGEGFREIILHARQSARPFYEKLGYVALGDEFGEVTLPHRKMQKRLMAFR